MIREGEKKKEKNSLLLIQANALGPWGSSSVLYRYSRRNSICHLLKLKQGGGEQPSLWPRGF